MISTEVGIFNNFLVGNFEYECLVGKFFSILLECGAFHLTSMFT